MSAGRLTLVFSSANVVLARVPLRTVVAVGASAVASLGRNDTLGEPALSVEAAVAAVAPLHTSSGCLHHDRFVVALPVIVDSTVFACRRIPGQVDVADRLRSLALGALKQL
jgi:hypothetical protein